MLNIEIKRATQVPGIYSCYLSFSGYNENWIAVIRQFNTRKYDKDTRTWEFPLYNLSDIVSRYQNVPITIHWKKDKSPDVVQVPELDLKRPLFPHQQVAVEYGLMHPKYLLLDSMGCVAGDTVVELQYKLLDKSKYAGLRKRPIREFYKLHKERPEIKFKARCLKDDHFGLNDVVDILYSGEKEVFELTTEDGKNIKVTKDHKILTPNGYVELQNLKVGDTILTNGDYKCIECGSTENICKRNGKFKGYCRKCMYKYRPVLRGKEHKALYASEENPVFSIHPDGYVYISYAGVNKHPNHRSDGLGYHIYLMTKKLGRPLKRGECVHHIDGNKLNNSIENLKLMTISEHSKEHSKTNVSNFYKDFVKKNGSKIIMVPHISKIKSIEYFGITDTYDIKMLSPYNNFIANKIVVHNCGKTGSVIATAIALKKLGKIKQCLIICCVSDLQYNWVNEIKTVCDEDYWVLGTRYRKNKKNFDGTPKEYAGSVSDRIEDLKTHKEFFLITNKETLQKDEFVDILRGKTKFKTDVTFLAIDEVHKGCGNPTNVTGKNLQKLDNMEYIIPMTGTPLRNKPFDAWAPLHLIGKENASYSQFKAYYSVYGQFNDVVEYKNLENLQMQLQDCSLRRVKEEVLKFMPPKIFQNVYVTMNDRQQMIYDEAYSWALANIDLISDSPNPLAQLIRLRQATGYTGILSSTIHESAKLDRIEEDVEEIIENNEKCLIFSNWTDITDELYRRLSAKYKCLRITGKDVKDGNEVEDIKHKFQTDPEYKILIGTTSKMGTGHTLTAASWVLFADEPWTMADKDQAVDRTHRPGQNNTVNIRTYITKDTIDEQVNKIVENKGDMAKFIVDGQVKQKKGELVKFLLNIEQ